jgi:nicotinate-nucleotide pyrophosphorylase (carboxylating)
MLEKYAVQLGGGRANGFGLDDGVLITQQHLQFTGGIPNAIAAAQKELGHVHRVQIQVGSENELREAINAGAQGLILKAMPIAELKGAVELARELAPHVALQFDGNVSLENVNEIAASGVDAIVVSQITTPPNLLHISFQIHPF